MCERLDDARIGLRYDVLRRGIGCPVVVRVTDPDGFSAEAEDASFVRARNLAHDRLDALRRKEASDA